MKIAKKHSGIWIGAFFAAGSLISCATLIVPIMVVMVPGALVESVAAGFVNNEPYSNVGKLTILIFSLLFVLVLAACLFGIKRQASDSGHVSIRRIIWVMALLFFVVHPLGFYIYWGTVLDFRGDGQLMFSALVSFPFSSFAFVLIGWIMDLVKNKSAEKFTQPAA